MDTTHTHCVDEDVCKGDGICVRVCPKDIFVLEDKKAKVIESRAADCIGCGQCIAVCPMDAVHIEQLPAEGFETLAGNGATYGDLHGLLSARRSVRNFKKRPVERELIEKIVQTAATAPMGAPPHATEILVIDDPDALDQLRRDTVDNYRRNIRVVKHPFVRPFIKRQVGAELFHTIETHVVPNAVAANDAFDRRGEDKYLYHAPVLMLFHAHRSAPSYEQSAHLVCAYAMLAAQSLGLGTTVIGMVPPIIDRSKALRRRYEIPSENKVITSLILGYPKFRYRKSITRQFPSVRFFKP